MVYLFLANGFEEIEALCPLDLLRRAGVNVMTVGVGEKVVRGSHGIEVIADITTFEAEKLLEKNPADMVILPGGMPGTLNLKADEIVNKFIKYVVENDKFLAAICAAPSILGELGLLRGKEAICFPGFEDKLDGAVISGKSVVRDGKIITAKGMGVALEFGLALVSALVDDATAEQLRASVQAQN
ncbi:MAG: DJ-1/PfpI family protein [Clostridiales bacterium]|nr:DJ-1/PfpI family protein [Clostridiales bacterium]